MGQTNFEYFKDEIIEITAHGNIIALCNERPVKCANISCKSCGFGGTFGTCCGPRKEWLTSEHIEKPKLTKKERQFCELVETGWIVKNGCSNDIGNCDLVLYGNKPKKVVEELYWIASARTAIIIDERFPGCNFSFITWGDKEPWSVEELLKLEYEQEG